MRVVHTNLLFWAQGFCVHPKLVLIRPERCDDVALLAHEFAHARQMESVGTLKFYFKYAFSRSFVSKSKSKPTRCRSP